MSKSLNNSVDPFYIVRNFPVDGLRHYLLSFGFSKDNNFSYAELVGDYNHHLVNLYGNLISRLAGMLKKYTGGKIVAADLTAAPASVQKLDESLTLLINGFPALVEADDLSAIIGRIGKLIGDCNKAIEVVKP